MDKKPSCRHQNIPITKSCDLLYYSFQSTRGLRNCRSPIEMDGTRTDLHKQGWDLAEWSERCASIPKITGSNPSGGSQLTFRSDLLLTARDSKYVSVH
jgi:hypothetical protein